PWPATGRGRAQWRTSSWRGRPASIPRSRPVSPTTTSRHTCARCGRCSPPPPPRRPPGPPPPPPPPQDPHPADRPMTGPPPAPGLVVVGPEPYDAPAAVALVAGLAEASEVAASDTR